LEKVKPPVVRWAETPKPPVMHWELAGYRGGHLGDSPLRLADSDFQNSHLRLMSASVYPRRSERGKRPAQATTPQAPLVRLRGLPQSHLLAPVSSTPGHEA
jgi:hypothetical protein